MTVGTKVIHVKPGMGTQNILKFSKEGHQRQGMDQSDLVICF
jgi:DnaJ-class molecular chaperone